MDKGTFVAWCMLGFGGAMAVFFPLGARRRAGIPPPVWWTCLILGTVSCGYGLIHSAKPSFAPRITTTGAAWGCTEQRVGRDSKFAFHFVPQGGDPVVIETHIIMPHWGNSSKFDGRTLRIVYLNDVRRNPSNEAIDIKILAGDSAGWHDSLDARPWGIWLAIPIGAALASFGYVGIRNKKADAEAMNPSDDQSLARTETASS